MTAPAAAKAQARRVLLVDDDVAFTAMMKEFLLSHKEAAWIVHMAENYSAALACLKVNPVDLIVLDIQLPVMDGLQFLTLLKRTHPEIQVVILTNRATEENRKYALEHGAALFLDKTAIGTNFESLYAALETTAAAGPAEGFRGLLRQVGLTEVLQMECLGRKSSILEISTAKEGGRIFIRDGSIIHAETASFQGEPALFHLLGLNGGEFHLKPFASPRRQTIDGNWESLVMEAARLRDEALAEGEAESRGTAAPDRPPDAGPAENRQVTEIVLCSGTNEVVYEWRAAGLQRRVQLLDLLSSKAVWMTKLAPLGRADRLEVREPEARTLVLLQPDRKVLVRTAIVPAENPKS